MPSLWRWHGRIIKVSWLAAIALLIAPAVSAAVEARLILPDGKPAAGCQISIPGAPGSVRANGEGRFTLPERAEPPLTLVIMGARGEIFPPVHITEKASGVLDIHLQPVLREAVTVTSGVAPNIEAPPAAGTSVIGREDLEERKPEHLVDTLVRTPGVEIRGEGPAAVPVLRGLAGGRTLILHDDARITAERRAGASATFLDPFSLAAVEVSRGPGSVAYGSDALGGVIHARPREPIRGDSGLLYEATGSFGGRNLLSAGVEWTHDVPGGALLATIHAREADDAKGGGGDRILNSSYRDRGGAFRFASPMAAGLFRAGLMINESFDAGAPAADAEVTRTYYPEEISRRLTLGWHAAPSRGLSSLEAHFALGSYDVTTNRERLPAAAVTRQISSAEVNADDASLRVAATRMTSSGRIHAGMDVVSRFNLRATGATQQFDLSDQATTRATDVSIDDAQKIDRGAFVIYDWNVSPKLMVSGGARVDAIEMKNRAGYFGARSRQDTALSGHAAASITPFAGLTGSLQVASGHRARPGARAESAVRRRRPLAARPAFPRAPRISLSNPQSRGALPRRQRFQLPQPWPGGGQGSGDGVFDAAGAGALAAGERIARAR
jgi:outer membrane receptor protein involved in Fe transport